MNVLLILAVVAFLYGVNRQFMKHDRILREFSEAIDCYEDQQQRMKAQAASPGVMAQTVWTDEAKVQNLKLLGLVHADVLELVEFSHQVPKVAKSDAISSECKPQSPTSTVVVESLVG